MPKFHLSNHITTTKKRSAKIIYVILIFILLGGLVNFVLLQPRCLTVTDSYPQQMNYPSNNGLLTLAHNLGAQQLVRACSGDIELLRAPDGYGAYVIKIQDTSQQRVQDLHCPMRPLNDGSSEQYVKYIRRANHNKNKVAGYYSPEGAQCSGGDINIIVTTQDNEQKISTYIVFTARKINQD